MATAGNVEKQTKVLEGGTEVTAQPQGLDGLSLLQKKGRKNHPSEIQKVSSGAG